MTKPIRTYDDLLTEKSQLEALLQAQKELLLYDLKVMHSEIRSATSGLSVLGKLVSRDRTNFLMNMGVNKVIDLVFKKVLLSRAGWLTRLAVPFLVKNVSSHILAEKKDKIVDKLFSWITPRNGNGKAAPEMYEES
jgi:hypothetical protein